MQKFRKGDIVKVGKLRPHQVHFPKNCYAMVKGSYETECLFLEEEEVNEPTEYSLLILTDAPQEVSWYEEDDLTLVTQDKDEVNEIRLAYLELKPVHRKYAEAINKMIAKKRG